MHIINIRKERGKMEYLDILKQVLVYFLTAYWCYQAIISLCALIKLKDKLYITNKNHKLTIHNLTHFTTTFHIIKRKFSIV